MTLVPLHPETTADPATVRWVVPAGLLRMVGIPAVLPEPLAELRADGTIAAVEVGPDGVLVTLGAGQSWRDRGAQIRSALTRALADPAGWIPGEHGSASADDRLRAAVQGVLDADVGDYIRSHGGRATLVSAHDHRARVRLEGECDGCPARGLTLGLRVERAVRARYPELVSVDLATS